MITYRDFSKNSYTKDELIESLRILNKEKFNFFVGTDSQVMGKKLYVVSVIVCHKERASKIFYIKEKLSWKEYKTLRSRMLMEAYKSLEIAMEIDDVVDHLSVHLDIGNTIKSKTSMFHNELSTMISSQGFDCKTKPDSWAASAVADRVLRSC